MIIRGAAWWCLILFSIKSVIKQLANTISVINVLFPYTIECILCTTQL